MRLLRLSLKLLLVLLLGLGFVLSAALAWLTFAVLPVGALQAQPVASGYTQPVQELKLSLTAAGRIEALMVREGDRVRAGQVLLHLDRTLESLEVRRRQLLRGPELLGDGLGLGVDAGLDLGGRHRRVRHGEHALDVELAVERGDIGAVGVQPRVRRHVRAR